MLDEIIHFLVGAADGIRVVDGDVGGADHDLVEKREDEHDAAILVLEEELVVADGLAQFGIVQDQVRAFGRADVMGLQAQVRLECVDPRPGGVDDQLRLDVVRSGRLTSSRRVTVFPSMPDKADVVQGAGMWPSASASSTSSRVRRSGERMRPS